MLLLLLLRLWWAFMFRLWLRLSPFGARWCCDTFAARLLLLRGSYRTFSLSCTRGRFYTLLFYALLFSSPRLWLRGLHGLALNFNRRLCCLRCAASMPTLVAYLEFLALCAI